MADQDELPERSARIRPRADPKTTRRPATRCRSPAALFFESAHGVGMDLYAGAVQTTGEAACRWCANCRILSASAAICSRSRQYRATHGAIADYRFSRCHVAPAEAATAARIANQSVPSKLDGGLNLSLVLGPSKIFPRGFPCRHGRIINSSNRDGTNHISLLASGTHGCLVKALSGARR
jgi:hypothetical protein